MLRWIAHYLGLIAIAALIVVVGFVAIVFLNDRGVFRLGGPSIQHCGESQTKASIRRLVSDAYNQQAWTSRLEAGDIAVRRATAISINRDVQRVECEAWISVTSNSSDRSVEFPLRFSVASNLARDGSYVVELAPNDIPFLRLGEVARRGRQTQK